MAFGLIAWKATREEKPYKILARTDVHETITHLRDDVTLIRGSDLSYIKEKVCG